MAWEEEVMEERIGFMLLAESRFLRSFALSGRGGCGRLSR